MNATPKTALSFVSEALTIYCEASTSNEPTLCQFIREQSKAHPKSHWVCGPLVGSLLKTLILLMKARRVLDVGTYLGYSAAYMASADSNLNVISLELNPELATRAKEILASSPLAQKISIKNTEAFSWLSTEPILEFDLIFFDSNRSDLMQLYPLFVKALRPGGILVMDNACLRGRVLAPERPWDHETVAFNSAIQADSRFLTTLLPIRDGVLLAIKLV